MNDEELRSALRLLAADRDPVADIATTVRTRLNRRQRVRRMVVIGSLAAGVAAVVTTTSLLFNPVRQPTAPVGAPPGTSGPAPATLDATTPDPTTPDNAPGTAPPTATENPPPPASQGAPSTAGTTETSDPYAGQVFIRCYTTTDLSDPNLRNYLGITASGGDGTAAEAVQMCGRRWTEGTLSTDPPWIHDEPTQPTDSVVPELVACVLPNEFSGFAFGSPQPQEIAVLPGAAGSCGQLGLQAPRS